MIALLDVSKKICWSLLAFLVFSSGFSSGNTTEYPVNYEMVLRSDEHFIPVATCGPLLIGVMDARFQREIGTAGLTEEAVGVFYIIDLWTVNISEGEASLYSPRIHLIDEAGRKYQMSETATLTSTLSSSEEYSHVMLFLDLTPNIQYVIRLIFDVDEEFDPFTAKLGIASGKWGSKEEYSYIWARQMTPADFI